MSADNSGGWWMLWSMNSNGLYVEQLICDDSGNNNHSTPKQAR
jgi:hypothetical protein